MADIISGSEDVCLQQQPLWSLCVRAHNKMYLLNPVSHFHVVFFWNKLKSLFLIYILLLLQSLHPLEHSIIISFV